MTSTLHQGKVFYFIVKICSQQFTAQIQNVKLYHLNIFSISLSVAQSLFSSQFLYRTPSPIHTTQVI